MYRVYTVLKKFLLKQNLDKISLWSKTFASYIFLFLLKESNFNAFKDTFYFIYFLLLL